MAGEKLGELLFAPCKPKAVSWGVIWSGADVNSAPATRRLAVTAVLAHVYVSPGHLTAVVVAAPILPHAAAFRPSGGRFAPGLP
jgi:hypothetical protein